MTPYCGDLYRYRRRSSREVMIGNVGVGGHHPIRVQSMITCDTMDTAACIEQTLELAAAGCEIVRITAPTVKDAANLEHIVAGLRAAGCQVPIVADIHFKPEAAMEAAKWVDKVRINPGNYADSKKFKIIEYSDEQYAAELERLRQRFTPLVLRCQERRVAMRIGTNHGSLSDRILNRYGDTPLGMVESALEFARIARDLGYHDFVFSMKSSNPKVMIAAYRLLASRLAELDEQQQQQQQKSECRMESAEVQSREMPGDVSAPTLPSALCALPSWNYPLHLGVTEAGDGEDGRIKSAIGIGSLLNDGIGDTIRVSLTEDSIHEIPVARALVSRVVAGAAAGVRITRPPPPAWDPFCYERRHSTTLHRGGAPVGGEDVVKVAIRREKFAGLEHKIDRLGDYKPDFVYEDAEVVEVDPQDAEAIARLNESSATYVVTVKDGLEVSPIAAFRLLAASLEARHPILLKDTLDCGLRNAECGSVARENPHSKIRTPQFLDALLTASANLGSLLCDGIGDAILVQGEEAPGQSLRLSFNTLQAAGARIFKTDYVACPSCGRTLFNLQETTARIKAATAHLKGVKIAIMGCIVNGPGEMADADFGYVGGAPGKINLYVGRTAVKFNIPQGEAVERLVDLIREHGKWIEAVPQTAVASA